MSDALFLDTVKTPIGDLLLVADARGVLRMLEFEDKPERWRSIFRRHFKNGEFAKKRDPGGVSTKLKRYFDGDISALDEIQVDAQGTDFQHACWKNLRRIPAGTATTYGALAKKMGKPAAMRAVGLANGANPIAVVVPCHRVVGADGSLTGYGGGLERKRWLLDHEARHAAKKRESNMTIQDRAKTFAALHAGPRLLVLPNAWDAGSARVIQHAGATAIATSSAAVAWAHGYADGQFLPWETLLHTVSEIVKTVTVPVSADIEAAYAHDAATAAKTVGQVIEAGAVGINIEDGNDSPDLLAKKIENLREASRKQGVDIWVNARVDTYLRGLVKGEGAYPETVRRAKLYREAGASSIFVPGFPHNARLAELVKDVVLPLNLLAWPGLPDGAVLEKAGVRRLSAGSGIGKAVLSETLRLAKDFLAHGASEPLVQGPLTNAEINGMLRKS